MLPLHVWDRGMHVHLFYNAPALWCVALQAGMTCIGNTTPLACPSAWRWRAAGREMGKDDAIKLIADLREQAGLRQSARSPCSRPLEFGVRRPGWRRLAHHTDAVSAPAASGRAL